MRRRRISVCSIFIVLEAARAALAFCPRGARALLADARFRDAGRGPIFASGRGEAATRSVVMAGSMAPPRTKAEKTSEKFSFSREGMVVFGSSQRVEVRTRRKGGGSGGGGVGGWSSVAFCVAAPGRHIE